MMLKYFKHHEFDSPDKPGSGEYMEAEFLQRLDVARDIAGFPFIITSGFRTVEHQRTLREQGYSASKNSSHLLGWAADIAIEGSRMRFELVDALLEAGFTRIGVANNFIHVDCDPNKTQHLLWLY